ncbi:MAG: MJ0042-type zinc finger domain-containing protein [Desulfatibacillaceae bacterium]
MDFQCPHCDEVLTVDDDMIGARGRCPECGGLMQVPDPARAGMVDVSKHSGEKDGTAVRPETEPARSPDSGQPGPGPGGPGPAPAAGPEPSPGKVSGEVRPDARTRRIAAPRAVECQLCGYPFQLGDDRIIVPAQELRSAVDNGFLPPQAPLVRHEVRAAQKFGWLDSFESAGIPDHGEGAVYSLCRPGQAGPWLVCEGVGEDGEFGGPVASETTGLPVTDPHGLLVAVLDQRQRNDWVLCEWCARGMSEESGGKGLDPGRAATTAAIVGGALLGALLLYWIL